MISRRLTTSSIRDDAGIALLIVLWLVALLSLQVGLLNASMRDGVRVMRNSAAIARGQALVQASVELAVFRLLTKDAELRWAADGSVRDYDFGDGTVALIAIHDENGRININSAEPAVLAGLLKALGTPDDAVKILTDRILAARTAQPFVDPQELIRVVGMSKDLANALSDHITIYTGDGRINPRFAGETVLRSLPNVGRQSLGEIMRQLRTGAEGAFAAEAVLTPASRYISNANGPAYRITVKMRDTQRNAIGSGEAVVAIGLDAATPYRTLAWRFSPSTVEVW